MQIVMDLAKIQLAYAALFKDFLSVTGHLPVRKGYTSGYQAKLVERDKVVVNSLIYLPEWPYRSADSSKSLNILIKSNERYDCVNSTMTKSTVQVMYLVTEDDGARPVLALHYDFEFPALPAHAYYHAQLGATDLSAEEKKEIGFRNAIKPLSADFPPGIRVPTPHMCLGAVLVAISSDHLSHQSSGEFVRRIRNGKLKDWSSSCTGLPNNNSRYKGNLWHSHHWYD